MVYQVISSKIFSASYLILHTSYHSFLVSLTHKVIYDGRVQKEFTKVNLIFSKIDLREFLRNVFKDSFCSPLRKLHMMSMFSLQWNKKMSMLIYYPFDILFSSERFTRIFIVVQKIYFKLRRRKKKQ